MDPFMHQIAYRVLATGVVCAVMGSLMIFRFGARGGTLAVLSLSCVCVGAAVAALLLL